MLSGLKRDIARESAMVDENDAILESVATMDIRNTFVDPDEVDENDPELQRLIDEIPESDEDISEEDVDQLTESLIAELD